MPPCFPLSLPHCLPVALPDALLPFFHELRTSPDVSYSSRFFCVLTVSECLTVSCPPLSQPSLSLSLCRQETRSFGVYTPTWYTHGATGPIIQAFSGGVVVAYSDWYACTPGEQDSLGPLGHQNSGDFAFRLGHLHGKSRDRWMMIKGLAVRPTNSALRRMFLTHHVSCAF